MSDSDIRLVHPISSANRGVRSDGSDANISRAEQDVRTHNLRRSLDQTGNAGTGNAAENRRISGGASRSTAAATQGTSDNFATSQASAWTQFMADMLGALDVALTAQDAAKDGKIDSAEWNSIFGAANKDGQVSLLEISAMYAGLQDMHDKGALSDDEYSEGVGALERELSARYSGGSSNGLDQLARLYINTLQNGGGDVKDDHTAVQGSRQPARGVDRPVDDAAGGDVTQTMARRPLENDGVEERARLNVRRTGVNDRLASTLADMGIHQVSDVNESRRGAL